MITQLTKCLLATLLSLGLAACGLTGPLYMPPPEQPQTQSTPQAQTPATAEAAPEAAPH
ncbi:MULTISPECIES: lipoprotein [Aeromonas]|uniref:LPS translocon maturation chaperone LptM n=1 Tax=Aeromonas TaxID=642 RepID=UPI000E203645|nr:MULTISPECIES: lipoprotein [Aeromonas]ELM3753064.1 lipoprotein [Aeromonas dhakensis]MBF8448054.1 lipoprotein [Aeromonas dhakensis]MBL0461948.1 lipoprotein [Aeromonas dhakensis]MBL0533711.1 lipoprotein [Aeromonas dhakensis]MBL0603480.1 lipoprotein [Aeromonas dhakensis]